MTPGPCCPLCLTRSDSLPEKLELTHLPEALGSLFRPLPLLPLLGVYHTLLPSRVSPPTALLKAPQKTSLQVPAHLSSHCTSPRSTPKKEVQGGGH